MHDWLYHNDRIFSYYNLETYKRFNVLRLSFAFTFRLFCNGDAPTALDFDTDFSPACFLASGPETTPDEHGTFALEQGSVVQSLLEILGPRACMSVIILARRQ